MTRKRHTPHTAALDCPPSDAAVDGEVSSGTIAPVRHGLARRLTRPYGFVDDGGTAWHWRVGQVVTGDVLLALEAKGAPLGEAEPETAIMQVKPTNRFTGSR